MRPLYLHCFFQLYLNSTLDSDLTNSTHILIKSIIPGIEVFTYNTGNVNCKWQPSSMYYGSNPLEVNTFSLFDTGLLCYCPLIKVPNCHRNAIGPIYPGKMLKLRLFVNSKVAKQANVLVSFKVYDDDDAPHMISKVSSLLEAEQVAHHTYI